MTSPHDFDSHSMLPPEDEVEFLDYIAVLVRRRWLIFWTTTLCILAAVGFVLRRQVEVFTAEAIILPAKAREYLNLDGIQQHPSRHSFYLDILQSPAISRRVLEKEYEYVLNGQPGKGNLLDYFGVASMHKGFDALAGISDFASERTGVITITIETLAPRLSAAVANEYVAQLRAYNQRTRRASSARASRRGGRTRRGRRSPSAIDGGQAPASPAPPAPAPPAPGRCIPDGWP